MRVGCVNGDAALIAGDRALSVAGASQGRFGPDPMQLFEDWDDFASWGRAQDMQDAAVFEPSDLSCPVPRPSQIFAIGINYSEHAAEADMAVPEDPMVFTKFPSALAGPFSDIPMVPGSVDWEVELVLVMARTGRDIPSGAVADAIAGFTVGQDVSERDRQLAGANAQFNIAKSHRGFAPIGPAVVTLDEFDDPWDLEIRCERNKETVQAARTSQLINDIPRIVTYLSAICELRAGDLIFTGTPSGVGMGRTPPEYLETGDVLRSTIQGIGSIVNRCV